MVIHYIDHAAHASLVDGIDQGFEVLNRAVFRINAAVVLVRIRTSQRPFAVYLSDRMDREEPNDIRPKVLYTVKVRDHSPEGAFFCMVANKNRIDDLLLQFGVCIMCHFSVLLTIYYKHEK